MPETHCFRLNTKSRQLNNALNHEIECDMSNEWGEMTISYMIVRLTLRANGFKFKISRNPFRVTYIFFSLV